MKKTQTDAEKVVSGIVDFLSEEGKDGLLPFVSENLDTMVSLRNSANRITITSVVPLSATQKQTLISVLKSKMKKELPLVEKIDTSLLGGFTVRVGDLFMDASLAHDMKKAKELLLS